MDQESEIEAALEALKKAGYERGLVPGIEALAAERDELLEFFKRDAGPARPLSND